MKKTNMQKYMNNWNSWLFYLIVKIEAISIISLKSCGFQRCRWHVVVQKKKVYVMPSTVSCKNDLSFCSRIQIWLVKSMRQHILLRLVVYEIGADVISFLNTWQTRLGIRVRKWQMPNHLKHACNLKLKYWTQCAWK